MPKNRVKKEIKTFWMASTLAIAVLLAAAVLQINNYIHQNSRLSDYQKQIASILADNDTLEARLSQTNSRENFDQYAIAQAGNYEKVDVASVRYIHASSAQLVKR
jgi:hypothetical protein